MYNMIEDFKNLKKHCNVNYKIKKRKFKIGDLTDNQLEVSAKILKNKVKPNKDEVTQLNATNYIMKYRSKKAIERLQNDMSKRRIGRAERTANLIHNWILKVTHINDINQLTN